MTVIDVLLPLLAFGLLTAANAFFVAAEFSLVTVDRALVEEQAAAGDRRSRRLLRALRSLSFQLSGAQLGITLSALLTGYLAEPAIARLLAPALKALPGGDRYAGSLSVGIALVLATLVSMLFGELIPKNAALARPHGIALWTAGPQRLFSALLRPVIATLNGAANMIVRRLGIEPQEELASARSPEELGLLAAISAHAGALPTETATLLRRTIRFGDKRAAEAMTPRVDVIGLETTATVDQLLALARRTGHTRFPVYLDTLDQVVGVASVLDALGVPVARRPETLVRSIAREAVLVPESLDLDGVLAALRDAGAELAIVVDEYGGTDGIVSTEDLVEELVGEIADEYDPPGRAHHDEALLPYAPITAPAANQDRMVPGLLRGDELAEQTGFPLPDGPYETLAGFMLAQLGRIPAEGETVEHDGWTFTVTSVERHRIEQVRVRQPADWAPVWTPDGDQSGHPAPDPSRTEPAAPPRGDGPTDTSTDGPPQEPADGPAGGSTDGSGPADRPADGPTPTTLTSSVIAAPERAPAPQAMSGSASAGSSTAGSSVAGSSAAGSSAARHGHRNASAAERSPR